jgi:hypothetical protein
MLADRVVLPAGGMEVAGRGMVNAWWIGAPHALPLPVGGVLAMNVAVASRLYPRPIDRSRESI